MRKYLKILTFVIIATIIQSCGFKPLKLKNINDISVNKLITEGNRSINFKLSNYLKQTLSFEENRSTKINIHLKTEKIKKIKEKNNKNEITKYSINLITSVQAEVIYQDKEINFSINKQNDFKVNDQHNITIQNEKRVTKQLANSLSEEIFKTLLLKINDI